MKINWTKLVRGYRGPKIQAMCNDPEIAEMVNRSAKLEFRMYVRRVVFAPITLSLFLLLIPFYLLDMLSRIIENIVDLLSVSISLMNGRSFEHQDLDMEIRRKYHRTQMGKPIPKP